jgi:hypothetical protein
VSVSSGDALSSRSDREGVRFFTAPKHLPALSYELDVATRAAKLWTRHVNEELVGLEPRSDQVWRTHDPLRLDPKCRIDAAQQLTLDEYVDPCRRNGHSHGDSSPRDESKPCPKRHRDCTPRADRSATVNPPEPMTHTTQRPAIIGSSITNLSAP